MKREGVRRVAKSHSPDSPPRLMRSARLQSKVPAPQRPPRRAGRPSGRDPDDTRELILNVAEELFALNGYDGTSVRNVATACHLQIAAISYHFGLKEELFDTVIARRAAIMTQWRERTLVELREQYRGSVIDVQALVRAYIQPFFESASHGDPGWRNYAALMGRLANSALGTEVIARHYDPTARAYLAEFKRSLPGISEAAIVDGFMFMVASMLALCAGTGRAQHLTTTSRRSAQRDLSEAFDNLVTFLVAGFVSLPNEKVARARTQKIR